jgi:hypothetical protein
MLGIHYKEVFAVDMASCATLNNLNCMHMFSFACSASLLACLHAMSALFI